MRFSVVIVNTFIACASGVSRDEETIGLDVPEMGVAAYPDSLHL